MFIENLKLSCHYCMFQMLLMCPLRILGSRYYCMMLQLKFHRHVLQFNACVNGTRVMGCIEMSCYFDISSDSIHLTTVETIATRIEVVPATRSSGKLSDTTDGTQVVE